MFAPSVLSQHEPETENRSNTGQINVSDPVDAAAYYQKWQILLILLHTDY